MPIMAVITQRSGLGERGQSGRWVWQAFGHQRPHLPQGRHHHALVWGLIGMLLSMSVSMLGAWGTHAAAQERLGVEPPQRPGPVEPTFPPEPPPPPLSRPTLPPVPPPSPEERGRLPVPQVFVRQILVMGNTVFSEAELAAVTKDYVNLAIPRSLLRGYRLKGRV